MVEFKSGNGSVQSGYRPAVVFQNNVGNLYSPNIVVLPLTSCLKKMNQPTHVVIESEKSGLSKDSMVICENPSCITKDSLGKYVTTLSKDYMCKIAEANMLASSAISFIDPGLLISIREKALKLNAITM